MCNFEGRFRCYALHLCTLGYAKQSLLKYITLMPLTEIQQHLWERYRADENDRIRHVLMESLSQFIDSLSNTPQEQWTDWVLDVSRDIVDGQSSFPIRYPLFERVIFPVLYEGYIGNIPNCARWLAGFSQYIYKSKKCMGKLGESKFSEHALLQRAIELDPDDHLAKTRLIRLLASSLDYSIHEVPWGVLYGINGASVEECLMLAKELEDFCSLVDSENMRNDYNDLIEDCNYHFQMYADYLRNQKDFGSYEAFLNDNQS